MAPTIEFLSKYLSNSKRDGSMDLYSSDEDDEGHLSYNNLYESMELTLNETEEIDEALFWKEDWLPWNGPTCLAVVLYVIKLANDILYNVIKNLDILAREYCEAVTNEPEEEYLQMKEEFSSMLVNSFMPKVRKFFKVPKLHELSNQNNSLKENEILASFIDFLLQILNCEAHINSTEEQRYSVLQKELTFLLSLLGDIPFQCTELEEVKHILAEFEILANEAGNFIYSCIFSIFEVKAKRFIEGRNSLLKMVDVLNVKIKEHCTKFSELHPFVVSQTYDALDLIFIFDSLIDDLEILMNNQIHFIINEMKVHIIALHKELIISRYLLRDIRMAQDTVHMDELNESLVQIRDVAYEAEYLVNSYVVGNLPLWYLNLRLPVVIPKFKLIRMRLQEIKTIYDIKVLDIKKDFSREVPTQAMGTPITMIIDNVVGFDYERTKILDDLTGGSEDRQIISIIGMPGLGKTTIAREMYNSRLTLDHFDRHIWCVVSETYQKRNVLIDIWMSLTEKENKNNFVKMDNESLALEIYKSLVGRRYLIVMDDVWCSKVWEDLRRYFPDDRNGSRIVFTSRIRGTAPTNCIVYSLPLLTEDQCWRLLDKKVYPKEVCPPQLQVIGKRIAAKCRGLPLAVVVTAGVLANLGKTKSVWEKVETNLDSYMFDDDKSNCSKILELSFKHLPDHLKMCFLYFGTFLEDSQVLVNKLIWLWIAEGFIEREQEKSLELVAEEYLSDLINRSLVLIAERRYDGGIKACSIHDLLRDMCLRKSHEENFSKSVNDSLSLYEKHHRMFVSSEASTGGRPFGLYYRSFSGHLSHPSSNIPQMKLLRVMNLRPNSNSSNELKGVDLLVQLRYLAVDRMPKPLGGNFVNLEFLIINSDKTIHIPLVILKLVKLRHVEIKKVAEFEVDCYSCQTTNLRSLSVIQIKNDKDNEILRCSPHLRRLKCYYSHDDTLFPDFHSHTDLQILNMYFFTYFNGELTKVYFPSTIKKLKLHGLGLPWEEMSIIGRLPNLHVLRLDDNAFVGEVWETKDGEFQELRVLELIYNDSIKQWIIYSEHFPQLQLLLVDQCINLKEIPSEIGDIPTLQYIEVYNSGYQVYKSAVQIEQEQLENGNEELQVINNNEKNMEDIVKVFQEKELTRQRLKSIQRAIESEKNKLIEDLTMELELWRALNMANLPIHPPQDGPFTSIRDILEDILRN